jgi:biopolymer transport protein ExbD
MKFNRRPLPEPRIYLVPMIDVFVILLLFFSVSVSFRHGSKLALTLPSAQGMAIGRQQHQLVVAISADGRYSVDGQLLSHSDESTLKTVMQGVAGHLQAKPVDTQLEIRADANATHQSVVTVMDVAGQLGFVNVSIATVKPESRSR